MLYNESEKYNLDLLGFAALETPVDIRNSKNVLYHNYKNTNIIQKPIIQTLFLSVNYIEYINLAITWVKCDAGSFLLLTTPRCLQDLRILVS